MLAEIPAGEQVCQFEIFSCKQEGAMLTNLNKRGFITILEAQGTESLNPKFVNK